MAKARPSRKGSKSGRKPGNSRAKPKAAKSRRVKVVTAGKKVARPVARAKTQAKAQPKAQLRKAAPIQKLARPNGADGARKARISVSKPLTTEVMIPETPPPLPAPIASFTF
jgi:hypothetical protein